MDDDQRPTPAEDAEYDRQATERDPRYPARKTALESLDTFITEWLDAYEWTDGDNGYYSPTEQERTLLHDAVSGLTSEDEFVRRWAAWRALCGPGDPVAAAQVLHASVLGIVSELMRGDPHTDTTAGRVVEELSKAVEVYESSAVASGVPGVSRDEPQKGNSHGN